MYPVIQERFRGSLKHEWLLHIPQPTREHMKQDVADYIRYYLFSALCRGRKPLMLVMHT